MFFETEVDSFAAVVIGNDLSFVSFEACPHGKGEPGELKWKEVCELC